jgi:tyrosyl-tRNA synthetase
MRDSASVFGIREIPGEILPSSSLHKALKSEAELANPEGGEVPQTIISREELAKGIPAFKLFTISGLADSGGEARRLIKQGGAYINGRRLSSIDEPISDRELENDEILLRAGKKRYHKIKIGQGVKTAGI